MVYGGLVRRLVSGMVSVMVSVMVRKKRNGTYSKGEYGRECKRVGGRLADGLPIDTVGGLCFGFRVGVRAVVVRLSRPVEPQRVPAGRPVTSFFSLQPFFVLFVIFVCFVLLATIGLLSLPSWPGGLPCRSVVTEPGGLGQPSDPLLGAVAAATFFGRHALCIDSIHSIHSLVYLLNYS